MSLETPGVWEVGVWDPGVWADGVWWEDEAVAETILDLPPLPDFLDDPNADRCWLFELDAFPLAALAENTPAGGYSEEAHAEMSYGEGDTNIEAAVQTLLYSDRGYTAGVNVGRLFGGSDVATLGWDFTKHATLTPMFGNAVLTVTRTGVATRVNELGVVETVAPNLPRFTYNSVTKALEGLLRERAQDNLRVRSAEFDHSAWDKTNVTVTSNEVLAPDGTLTADRLTSTSDAGALCTGDQVAVNSENHVASVWLQRGSGVDHGGWIILYDATTATTVAGGLLNFETGEIYIGTGVGGVVAYKDGWYRVWCKGLIGAGNTARIYVGFSGGLNTSGQYVYAWGAMVAPGEALTTYIPTVDVAVSRGDEEIICTDISGFYNAAASTVYAEITAQANLVTAYAAGSFDDATANNVILFGLNTTSHNAVVVTEGVNQGEFGSGTAVPLTTSRLAFAFSANDVAISGNGAAVGTDSSVTLPTVNRLRLGMGFFWTPVDGPIRKFFYFPTRLSDTKLQQMSVNGPIFVTVPGPGQSWYEGRIMRGIRMERRIVGRDGVGGLARVYAEGTLVNTDGALDRIQRDYSLYGRPARIYVGRPDDIRENFTLVVSGVVERVWTDIQMLRINFSDGIARLDQMVNRTTYAGSGGLEGGTDLKGKYKPKSYGKAHNATPPLVRSDLLIYQVNDGAVNDVPFVYDRGIVLTKGTDYTSQSDMESNAPAAGNYRVWKGGGFFRLGSTPAGTITADIEGDATGGYITKTGEIVRRILTVQAELAVAEINTASFDALDIACPDAIGLWIGTDGAKVDSVINEVLAGAGAWGGFSRLGTFSVGRVAAADSTPVEEFELEDVIGIERLPLPSTVDPVVWRTRVGYQRNYTPQFDLAAGVTAARRTFAAEEYRYEKDEDASIQSRHLLAKDLVPVSHHYRDQASALAEAQRLFDLWGVERQMFRLRLPASALKRDLGEVVRITFPRFGLDGGADARVLGHAMEDSFVDLTVLV